MKIVQILPEMNVGGVEFVTLELAAFLVSCGHEAIVISHGGQLVEKLAACGARHVTMPVHRKSLVSLFEVKKLRRFFQQERPDIVHIGSRVPGWLAWLALKGMDPQSRPRLVSTVHGFYSVNAYSAVMTYGERVVAVSESIRDTVFKNYPKTPRANVRVIHGGVDSANYSRNFEPSAEWLAEWQQQNPQLVGKIVLLLPGRITRWKGQEHFIRLVSQLAKRGYAVQGLIVGAPHPRKIAFFEELKNLAVNLGVSEHITFLGSRNDLREIMAISTIVYSLSLDPEAFGRVSLEAMALGKPVIGYDHGGVAEQLAEIFPAGKVAVGDIDAAVGKTREILDLKLLPGAVDSFCLTRKHNQMLEVYQELLASRR